MRHAAVGDFPLQSMFVRQAIEINIYSYDAQNSLKYNKEKVAWLVCTTQRL